MSENKSLHSNIPRQSSQTFIPVLAAMQDPLVLSCQAATRSGSAEPRVDNCRLRNARVQPVGHPYAPNRVTRIRGRPMDTWAEWLERVSDGASLRQIASRTSSSKSSLSKWRSTNRPPADAVIAITKAYDADLIEGLISAGSIEPEDLAHTEILRNMPTDFLVEELHRRWRAGEIMGPPDGAPS